MDFKTLVKKHFTISNVFEWSFFLLNVYLLLTIGSYYDETKATCTAYVYDTFNDQACGYCNAYINDDYNYMNNVLLDLNKRSLDYGN